LEQVLEKEKEMELEMETAWHLLVPILI